MTTFARRSTYYLFYARLEPYLFLSDFGEQPTMTQRPCEQFYANPGGSNPDPNLDPGNLYSLPSRRSGILLQMRVFIFKKGNVLSCTETHGCMPCYLMDYKITSVGGEYTRIHMLIHSPFCTCLCHLAAVWVMRKEHIFAGNIMVSQSCSEHQLIQTQSQIMTKRGSVSEEEHSRRVQPPKQRHWPTPVSSTNPSLWGVKSMPFH